MSFIRGFLGRFGRDGVKTNASAIYRRIVKQARTPGFYEDFAVPDTIDGRFDLLVLHTFLVLRRLKEDAPQTDELAQAVLDAMFSNMDDSLRHMGVGDLTVGKRIKKMSSAFYGRVNVYDGPLVSGDVDALAEALGRNLFRGEPVGDGVPEGVARYMIEAFEGLKVQPTQRFTLGLVDFSDLAVPVRQEEPVVQGEAGEERAQA